MNLRFATLERFAKKNGNVAFCVRVVLKIENGHEMGPEASKWHENTIILHISSRSISWRPSQNSDVQFWGTKKAPAGTPTTRTEFVKIKKRSEMGRHGAESHFEASFVEEFWRSSDLNPSRIEKMDKKIEKIRFFWEFSANCLGSRPCII